MCPELANWGDGITMRCANDVEDVYESHKIHGFDVREELKRGNRNTGPQG